MLVHSLKLSRHFKMRNKVVYSTQIFCSHHWRKLEKLMIHALARDSHSAATCITHTFLQRKGGRGENSRNSPADLIKLQNKSCSSRSPIYSTTHPCPVPFMRHSTVRETVTVWLAFITKVLHSLSWLTLEDNWSQNANNESYCKAGFSYLPSCSSAKSIRAWHLQQIFKSNYGWECALLTKPWLEARQPFCASKIEPQWCL